jgi:RNase P/RNase MRP subunit p29
VNIIGESLTVLSSTDPTTTGRSGRVLLETDNTILLDSGGRTIRVAKLGSSFMLVDSGMIVTGSDIAGRLQDRLGRHQV